ncbi:N6-adenosine-specific RNA methylase IME4 [Orbus hercynius]|uniref:N6-adenosine-specific RNA methylase IME4 n=1 Tax=Orbus hercynius TaxID=593135 RepID=A0A495RIE8_9GAMM|nr:MT-A70 family methyltransferase [Orbus hercynius]RKS87287.1 N6-adenosine-specific RNA methylase IME4 [Orbus hercynius]
MKNKYSLIYCDPPWQYSNQATRAATNNHYPAMTLDDLKKLPIQNITEDNAVLFMWFTGPMTKEAIELVESWGFKLKTTKGFTWIKLNKNYDSILAKFLLVVRLPFIEVLQKISFFGLGNHTRTNSEDCLIAIKGKGIERQNKSISQVIYAPIGRHSEKPKEARDRLDMLYGDVPRIELFARNNFEGWDVWGNECDNSIEME